MLTTELLRVVIAVTGEPPSDQLNPGEDAGELSCPDELSGEESNEEMDVRFSPLLFLLFPSLGDSALPGAGVEDVDDGLEWVVKYESVP